MKFKIAGFTLIEVLLALAIIAIALTALLRATSQTITNTTHIKDKSISHLVAMQAITAIQIGTININLNQEITEVTTILNDRWYWRAALFSTPIKSMQQINILVSKNQNGPFTDLLIGYRYST